MCQGIEDQFAVQTASLACDKPRSLNITLDPRGVERRTLQLFHLVVYLHQYMS